jgi:hypothetical protein
LRFGRERRLVNEFRDRLEFNWYSEWKTGYTMRVRLDSARSSNWARTEEVHQLDESIDEYLRMTGIIVGALVSGRKTATSPLGCQRIAELRSNISAGL